MDKKLIKLLLDRLAPLKNIGRIRLTKKNIWILLGVIGIAILTYVALDEPDDPDNLLVAQIKQGPMPKLQAPAKAKTTSNPAPLPQPQAEVIDPELPPTTPYFNPQVAIKVGEDYLPTVSKQGDTSIKAYAQPPLPQEQLGAHTLSLVIGGLGDNLDLINQATQTFPTTITLAFYPDGAYVKDNHPLVRTKGYETLLMLPLETMAFPLDDPGPLTLLTGDEQSKRLQNLQTCLGKVTGYVGVMNSGGGRFLRIDRCQRWLLEYIKEHGLLYAETKNYLSSMTPDIASEINSAYIALTPNQDQNISLAQQLKLIQEETLQNKHTVGYITLQDVAQIPMVQDWIGKLSAQKISLIPISQSYGLLAKSAIPILKGKPALKGAAPHKPNTQHD